MTRKIFKYDLPLTSNVIQIMMPTGAEILSVNHQEGISLTSDMSLWAVVDPDAPQVTHSFKVLPTGGKMPEYAGVDFIGTVLQNDGRFVWHIFEIKSGYTDAD